MRASDSNNRGGVPLRRIAAHNLDGRYPPVSIKKSRSSSFPGIHGNDAYQKAGGRLNDERSAALTANMHYNGRVHDDKSSTSQVSFSSTSVLAAISLAKRIRWNERVRVRYFAPIEADLRPHCFYSQLELSEIRRDSFLEEMGDSIRDDSSSDSHVQKA